MKRFKIALAALAVLCGVGGAIASSVLAPVRYALRDGKYHRVANSYNANCTGISAPCTYFLDITVSPAPLTVTIGDAPTLSTDGTNRYAGPLDTSL